MNARTAVMLTLALVFALAADAHAANPLGTLSQPLGSDGCVQEDAANGCLDGRALGQTRQAALAPDGRFLYVTAPDIDGVAVLTRDPAPGTLSQSPLQEGCVANDANVVAPPCANGRNLDGARTIALSPDGGFAYVGGLSGVAAFARDAGTGRLSAIQPGGCISRTGQADDEPGGAFECVNGRVITNVTAIAVSPDGRHVYAARQGTTAIDNAIVIMPRSSTDGTISQPPGKAGCLRADGTESTPEEQGDAGDQNPEQTGCAATIVRSFGTPTGMAFSADGFTLYVTTESSLLVLNRDPSDGSLTQRPGAQGCFNSAGTDGCGNARAMQFPTSVAASGSSVYVSSLTSDGVAHFFVAPSGDLSQPADTTGCIAQSETIADGEGLKCTTGRALNFASDVAISQDGKSVLVGGASDGGIESLAVLDRGGAGGLTQSGEKRCCLSIVGSASGPAGNPGCDIGRGLANADLIFAPGGHHVYSVGRAGVAFLRREVAPTCQDTSASVAGRASVAIGFSCSDRNGDAVSLAIAGPPTKGTASVSGTTVTYNAPCGFGGLDSLLVVPSDGVNSGPFASATITVTNVACPLPPPPPPTGKAPAARVITTTLKGDFKNRARLTIECEKKAPVPCVGKVQVQFKNKELVKKGKRKERVLLLLKSYSLKPGARTRFRFPLPKKARAALRLKASKRIPLTVIVTAPAQGLLAKNVEKGNLTYRG